MGLAQVHALCVAEEAKGSWFKVGGGSGYLNVTNQSTCVFKILLSFFNLDSVILISFLVTPNERPNGDSRIRSIFTE